MDTIYSEIYRLMEKLPDGDLNLCFDEEGNEIFSTGLDDVKEYKEVLQNEYDYPLVIVRETQVIVE
jgi:hypothetical protein